MHASTESILEILNMELEEGTMFREGKNEIVISKSVSEIFGEDKPLKIGDTIYLRRVDGKTLDAKIVGILKQSSSFSMFNTLSTPGIICPARPYYSSYFGSNAGFNVDSLSESIVAPTLIVAGRQDSNVGYRQAWDILENYPRATFAVLDRAGHLLEIEQQQILHTLIKEWRDRVEEYTANSK